MTPACAGPRLEPDGDDAGADGVGPGGAHCRMHVVNFRCLYSCIFCMQDCEICFPRRIQESYPYQQMSVAETMNERHDIVFYHP
eukprot:4462408-Pleurochrysis_carterae.AAC.2